MSIMTMSLPANQLAKNGTRRARTRSNRCKSGGGSRSSHTHTHAHSEVLKWESNFLPADWFCAITAVRKRQEGHSGLCYSGLIKVFLSCFTLYFIFLQIFDQMK